MCDSLNKITTPAPVCWMPGVTLEKKSLIIFLRQENEKITKQKIDPGAASSTYVFKHLRSIKCAHEIFMEIMTTTMTLPDIWCMWTRIGD